MMKRLLLLPYLITSLVVYTGFVLYHLPIMYHIASDSFLRRLAYMMTFNNPLNNVWWFAITIMGLVVALVAMEW